MYIYNVYIYILYVNWIVGVGAFTCADFWSWGVVSLFSKIYQLGMSPSVLTKSAKGVHLSEKDTPILVFGSSLLFFGPRSSPCQNAISIHIRCHFNDHAAR